MLDLMSHVTVAYKSWEDAEPDRFTVSLERSTDNGFWYVVVSGNATYLSSAQAYAASDYMKSLAEAAKKLNDIVK